MEVFMSDFMSRWLRHSSEPQKSIKRWLNQRCIGYQYLWKGEERLEICVIEGQVELEDGRIVMAWQRRIWPHYAGNYPGHEFAIEFERPRIDIRPAEASPDA